MTFWCFSKTKKVRRQRSLSAEGLHPGSLRVYFAQLRLLPSPAASSSPIPRRSLLLQTSQRCVLLLPGSGAGAHCRLPRSCFLLPIGPPSPVSAGLCAETWELCKSPTFKIPSAFWAGSQSTSLTARSSAYKATNLVTPLPQKFSIALINPIAH